jgi:predicted ribosomally synthesized peptide with SipW-like signal peptide
MTNQRVGISRRSVLAGLGTIGIASAGAGLGTTAFFNDTEAVDASLEAGRVDLLLDYRATYVPHSRGDFATRQGDLLPDSDIDGDNIDDAYVIAQMPDFRLDGRPASDDQWGATLRLFPCANEQFDLVDGDETTMFALDDVKPKDSGRISMSLHLCGNPAYLWLQTVETEDADGVADDPNPIVEPEDAVDGSYDGSDGTPDGDLDDYLWVRAYADLNCNGEQDGDDVTIFEGSLDAFLTAAASGLAIPRPGAEETSGNCYDADSVMCVAVDWYLPCFDYQNDAMGFAELPSTVGGTLAGELDAKGLPHGGFDDANIVQTDVTAFGITYAAIQCRHNGDNVNPFAQGGQPA